MSCACCGDVPPHIRPFDSCDELISYVIASTAVDPETGDVDVLGAFCFTAIIEGWFYRAEYDPATQEIRTLHRHTRDPLVALRDSS